MSGPAEVMDMIRAESAAASAPRDDRSVPKSRGCLRADPETGAVHVSCTLRKGRRMGEACTVPHPIDMLNRSVTVMHGVHREKCFEEDGVTPKPDCPPRGIKARHKWKAARMAAGLPPYVDSDGDPMHQMPHAMCLALNEAHGNLDDPWRTYLEGKVKEEIGFVKSVADRLGKSVQDVMVILRRNGSSGRGGVFPLAKALHMDGTSSNHPDSNGNTRRMAERRRRPPSRQETPAELRALLRTPGISSGAANRPSEGGAGDAPPWTPLDIDRILAGSPGPIAPTPPTRRPDPGTSGSGLVSRPRSETPFRRDRSDSLTPGGRMGSALGLSPTPRGEGGIRRDPWLWSGGAHEPVPPPVGVPAGSPIRRPGRHHLGRTEGLGGPAMPRVGGVVTSGQQFVPFGQSPEPRSGRARTPEPDPAARTPSPREDGIAASPEPGWLNGPFSPQEGVSTPMSLGGRFESMSPGGIEGLLGDAGSPSGARQ